MSTANLALKVHPNDNVYVALAELQPGADIPYNGQNLRVSEAIPQNKSSLRMNSARGHCKNVRRYRR